MTPRALAGCCVPQSHPRPGDNLPSRPVPSLSGSGARPRARPCPPGRRSGSAPGGRTGHTTRPLPLPAWPRLAAFLPCLLSGCSSLPPRFGAAGRSAWRCRSRRRDGGGHHRLSPQRCPSFPSPASLFSFTRRERYFCSLSFCLQFPLASAPNCPLSLGSLGSLSGRWEGAMPYLYQDSKPRPPALPGAARGTHSSGKAFEELKQECLSRGVLFEDPDFPACNSSLFFSEKPPVPFIWKRPGVSMASCRGG